MTVDGASITTPGTTGVLLPGLPGCRSGVSDCRPSISISPPASTSSGAINIVTRSGSNQYHGSGFYFYRDHHLAPIPLCGVIHAIPIRSFSAARSVRTLAGRFVRDRVFLFASYERQDQRGRRLGATEHTCVRIPRRRLPQLLFPSISSARASDAPLFPNHNAFARYTHDGNQRFWRCGQCICRQAGPVDESHRSKLVALTSVLSNRARQRPPVLVSSLPTRQSVRRPRRIAPAVSVWARRASSSRMSASHSESRQRVRCWRSSLSADRESRVAERESSSPVRLRLGARQLPGAPPSARTRQTSRSGLPGAFSTRQFLCHPRSRPWTTFCSFHCEASRPASVRARLCGVVFAKSAFSISIACLQATRGARPRG